MRRFTDLFRNLVSPRDDQKRIPDSVKTNRIIKPPIVPVKVGAPVFAPKAQIAKVVPPITQKIAIQESKNFSSNPVQTDKIEVPVYENDSEWDVVQRSINLFADNANLSGEAKGAFVRKWIAELEKSKQTNLYRNNEINGHLGNEINRACANLNTGLLGTYQAMIDPGRQARMMDELKGLQCIEKFDLGIVSLHLCREVKTDLINTVIGTIEEQKNAAQNLVNKAQKGQPEADRIYLATKTLANHREMRLNAAIKTAVLKMDTAKYQHLGLQPNEVSRTPRISSVQTPLAEKKELLKPAKSESDWVDEQTLKLFGNMKR